MPVHILLRRWLMVALLACFVITPLSLGEGAAKTSPEDAAKFINALGNEAVTILNGSAGDLEDREAKVRDLIKQNTDLKTIGRFVLGNAWRKATPEQRAKYQALFADYFVSLNARRLSAYAGESFKLVKAKPAGKQDAWVFTEISSGSGEPVKAAWRVRIGSKGPKILDISAAGVSMIMTQRSEFQAIVQKQGVEGLIYTLNHYDVAD